MVGKERDCGVCWSERCMVLLICKCEGLGERVAVVVERLTFGRGKTCIQ